MTTLAPPKGINALAEQVGLHLEPFQRRILKAAAGPEREKLFLLPRGSGKTTIAALDAVHYFLSTEGARVHIAASSEQQAALLYAAADQFAREIGDEHVVPRYNHLRWCPDPDNPKHWTRSLEVAPRTGASYTALPSPAPTSTRCRWSASVSMTRWRPGCTSGPTQT